jgi:hypothetical protein
MKNKRKLKQEKEKRGIRSYFKEAIYTIMLIYDRYL